MQLKGLQHWTTRDVRTLAAVVARRDRFRAVDCVREYRKLASRTRVGPAQGNYATHRAGSQSLAHHPSAANESLLLAALGGAVGLALSLLLTKFLIAIGPADVPRLDQVGLDARVLGFTVGVVALVGLLFGLAPALQCQRPISTMC